MKIVAIDFDGVLMDSDGNCIEAGRELTQQLFDEDENIIYIYTARENNPTQHELVCNFLNQHQIPHHFIALGKLKYDILIDDRAVNFNPKTHHPLKVCIKSEKVDYSSSNLAKKI